MKRRNSQKNKHPTLWGRVKGAIGKIGTLNIVLICVGVYTVYINWQMLEVYRTCGAAPETAWCSLIAALIGECGICGWIKTSKEKHRNKRPEEKDSDIDIEEVPVYEDDTMDGM